MALPHDLQIEGDDQCRAFGLPGALDQPGDEVAITHYVQLKPERLAGGLRNVFNGADAHGGQRERNPEALGGAGRQDFPIGVLHAGQTGRGNGHRHGDVLANHLRLERAMFDINRNPLAKLDLAEVFAVGPVSALGPGPGVTIVVEHGRDPPLGEFAKVFDARNGFWHDKSH